VRFDAAIDEVLRAGVERGDVHGVVAMVTTAEGVVYDHAVGVRDVSTGVPMTMDTVFPIASMTKAIATAGVMLAVERGLIGLDDPLGAIVPALGEAKVLTGFDGDGEPMLREPIRPITMRHLLTHTAGFGYTNWSSEIHRYRERYPAQRQSADYFRTPLLFDPGEGWAYGVGIDWATSALEAVTGTDLESWLRRNLFEPLGMKASWRVTPETFPRLASRHDRQPDGGLAATPPRQPGEAFASGGGGLNLTAGDYARFVRMILNRGRGPAGVRVLAEATVALMSQPDVAPNNHVRGLVSTTPSASSDGEFFPGVPKRYGLGFMINEAAAPTGRSAGSLAWAGIANCYYWIDPHRGIAGIFLTQLLPFLDARVLALFHAFEAAVYDAAAASSP
jgi:CubicO group peptidase (beta-lactamase class C family)